VTFLPLDWAEPGDPPVYNFDRVRTKPLAKPISHGSLTREDELELIRRYHEYRDLEALERVVEAHRPMVVRMAKHRWRANGTSLAALVEYGMLGLRIAAGPPRPSRTKKGKLVGFDFARGDRFSTYARNYADKEMRAALADDPGPALNPEFEQKAIVEIETWGETCKEEWKKEDDDRPLDHRGRLLLFRDL
jgi:DNA-directed RNA polymerase specialized sigma subunit